MMTSNIAPSDIKYATASSCCGCLCPSNAVQLTINSLPLKGSKSRSESISASRPPCSTNRCATLPPVTLMTILVASRVVKSGPDRCPKP
jgi:hypothetical protein